MHKPANMLEEREWFSWALLAAPLGGVAAAFLGGVRKQGEVD